MTSPYRIVEFDSWRDFKTGVFSELFGEAPVVRGRYLFRGQKEPSWLLAPAFDRSFPKVTGGERDLLETALVEHFRDECEDQRELKPLVNDEVALLALAQHSGVPTRLLDWTESPYIASFFAFQHAVSAFQTTMDELEPGKSVAVWALDTDHYVWNPGRGVEIVSPPTWDNARMRRQAGHFTRSRTPFRSLQEYVTHFGTQGQGALTVFLIPNNDAHTAIADLDLMGVNSSSMFADLGGRAKASVIRTIIGARARR